MHGNLLFIVLGLEKSKIIFLHISCSVRALFLRDHTLSSCGNDGRAASALSSEPTSQLSCSLRTSDCGLHNLFGLITFSTQGEVYM